MRWMNMLRVTIETMLIRMALSTYTDDGVISQSSNEAVVEDRTQNVDDDVDDEEADGETCR